MTVPIDTTPPAPEGLAAGGGGVSETAAPSEAPSARPAVGPDDPRDWITPEDLNVDPALLGLPLASPFQRAKAMAIDLALLTLLSHFGDTTLLLGCGWLALRWYRLQRGTQAEGRAHRGGWAGWAPALIVVAIGLYSSVQGLDEPSSRKSSKGDAALTREDDDDRPASAPRRADVTDAVQAAVATAITQASSAASSVAGSMPAADDSAAQREVKAQRLQIMALESQVRRLKDEAQRTPWERVRRWWELVGLNLAWALAWFVLWPMVWPGQTPGKRLMGLQVVELTGKPMKPMLCVRRYGGYAAGMATGGMGFLQILWDANRQGLQDKAAHTAVINLRNSRRLKLKDD